MSPEHAVGFQLMMILLFFICLFSGIFREGGVFCALQSNCMLSDVRRTPGTSILFNFFANISLTKFDTDTTPKLPFEFNTMILIYLLHAAESFLRS